MSANKVNHFKLEIRNNIESPYIIYKYKQNVLDMNFINRKLDKNLFKLKN